VKVTGENFKGNCGKSGKECPKRIMPGTPLASNDILTLVTNTRTNTEIIGVR